MTVLDSSLPLTHSHTHTVHTGSDVIFWSYLRAHSDDTVYYLVIIALLLYVKIWVIIKIEIWLKQEQSIFPQKISSNHEAQLEQPAKITLDIETMAIKIQNQEKRNKVINDHLNKLDEQIRKLPERTTVQCGISTIKL